jgi:hypothetical protein
MDKIITLLLLIGIIVLYKGCNIGADSSKSLSGGYFYRNEGGDIKDILSNKPDGGEIPSTVITFDYDKNFIIAKQKPKIPQDPLYSKDYYYTDGTDQNYFWLIIHDKQLVLGPMMENEFRKARQLYNVPDKLSVK